MSPVSIGNLALSHIGHSATVSSIDPPENSVEAQMLNQFFPLARDAALEQGFWSFATKRKALTALVYADDDENRWAFAYALPADLLKPIAILLPQSATALPLVWDDPSLRSWMGDPSFERFDFIVESLANGTRAIFTNVEDAILLYTAKITDTSKWTALFTTGMSYWLASMVAGPLTKDPRIQGAMLQAAQSFTGLAMVADANATALNPYNQMPGAVRARL